MLNLEKRGNVYHARGWHRGRFVSRSLKTTDRRAAMRALRAMEDRVASQAVGPLKRLTFDEAVELHRLAHLNYLRRPDAALQCLAHPRRLFGSIPITKLSPADFEAMWKDRLSAGLSLSWVRKEIAMAGAVLERQVLAGNLVSNPVRRMVSRPSKPRDTRTRILSNEELRRLLDCSWVDENSGKAVRIAPHLRLAILISDYTACRKGEILRMKWADVNFDKGIIFIPVAKSNRMGIERPRMVPMEPGLAEILKAEADKLRAAGHFNIGHLPVVAYEGRAIRWGFRMSWSNAVKAAKINNFRFHDLRHRAITRWAMRGHDVSTIMSASGHSDLGSLQRYINLSKEAAQIIAGRTVETPEPGRMGAVANA